MAVSLILLANTLIQGPYIQKEILKRISNAIGYDIEADDIELNLWMGIGISANDLSARSRKGSERFTASNVRLDLDIKSLLAGQVVPSSLYLYRPEIELPWEKGNDLDSGLKRFLPEKIPLLLFPGIHSLVIEQGHVTFTGVTFSLEDFDLRANRIASSPLRFMAISKGKIGFKGEKAGFEFNGRVNLPSAAEEHLYIDLSVKAGEIPITWFNWPASVRVKEGMFKTSVDVEGDPIDHLAVKGIIDLTGSGFRLRSIKKNRQKDFFIPEITLDFESIIRSDNIDVRPLKIISDDLEIDMGLLFDLEGDNGDPFLDLNFASGFMGVRTFKTYFPSQLLPNWLENRLFPMITSGDIKINSFGLKGDIDQIRHMKRPENRSLMEMNYECKGIEISGSGIGIPFRDVSADMILKGGLFSISGLNARFGGSLTRDSGMNIRDVYSTSRFYEFIIDGDFEIRELVSQKNMDVVPATLSGLIDQWPDIDGRIICRTSIGYQKGWDCPEILNGEFLVKGFSLDKEEYEFPVKFSEARVHIDDSDSDYILGSGSWGNSFFNISANFGIDGKMPYFKDGRMSANVDMNQAFAVLDLTGKTPIVFSETLPWDISLSGNAEGLLMKGHVNLEDTSIQLKDFKVGFPGTYDDNIVFELGINPNVGMVDINKALLRLKDSSISMTGTFDLQAKRFTGVGLHSTGLELKDLSVVSDKREIFSGGVLKGDLDITMPGQDGGGPLITGVTEGNGLSFQASVNSPLISDCSFRADFSGRTAMLNHCDLKTGESDLSITGEIRGWSGINGDIKVHSDYLNLSDIISEGSMPSRAGITRYMDLNIDLDASGGRWNKFPCEQAEADLVLESGNLYIKDSLIHLEYGDMTVKGHVLRIPEREMFFTGDVSIKDQPADELVESLGINYKGLKGNISIDGSLSIKGRERKEMLSGLNGSANVSINKGLIKNPNIMIKVLDFLSLQKIFEQRPPDLRDEGLYFESISAGALIENGVLRSENFVMRSPVLNAVAEGSADIPRKYVSCTLFAQPHGTIDSLVSKVPIIGYIITGENKSVVAYPFDVKGAFTDPEVIYVPFETMEGGIAGLLKRIFLTPARIFNKMDKTLNSSKEDTAQ